MKQLECCVSESSCHSMTPQSPVQNILVWERLLVSSSLAKCHIYLQTQLMEVLVLQTLLQLNGPGYSEDKGMGLTF